MLVTDKKDLKPEETLSSDTSLSFPTREDTELR